MLPLQQNFFIARQHALASMQSAILLAIFCPSVRPSNYNYNYNYDRDLLRASYRQADGALHRHDVLTLKAVLN